MTAGTRLTGESVPRLAAGVRLKDDRARGRRVLLAPERVLVPDETALEVLDRLDGTRSVSQLSIELAAAYDAPAETIEADALALLNDLAKKGFVTP
jgi:pyrroloquinoline quinone biosynthesis protein D